MAIFIVLLLLAACGIGVYMYVNASKDSTSSSGSLFETTLKEKIATAEAGHTDDSVYHTDDFVPQETIYTYHNQTPGICCPVCDAESPSHMQFCQVCGTRLDGSKFT